MIITNKLIANIVFGAVLIGGATVSGVAAKQLVLSSSDVADTLKNDVETIATIDKGSLKSTKKSNTSKSNTSTDPNSCIILLAGKKYNVEALRQSHSGGDIFDCGTDMTSKFNSEHGTDYARLSQYLVSDSTSLGSSNPSTKINNVKKSDDDSDDRNRSEREDDDSSDDENERENEVEIENEKEGEKEYEFEFED